MHAFQNQLSIVAIIFQLKLLMKYFHTKQLLILLITNSVLIQKLDLWIFSHKYRQKFLPLRYDSLYLIHKVKIIIFSIAKC